MTMQEGVTEDGKTPECCPDGTTPGVNNICPDEVEATTSNSGANATDSVSADPLPQMR
jgi:hypothetical protein